MNRNQSELCTKHQHLLECTWMLGWGCTLQPLLVKLLVQMRAYPSDQMCRRGIRELKQAKLLKAKTWVDGKTEVLILCKPAITNVFNEWHARDTSKKVRAVKEYQGKSGEHLCRIPPYGYRKDPESPKKWIVDEEAAKVVRWIFAQCMNGYGPSQIARMLKTQKVLTPSAYWLATGRRPTRTPEDNYAWVQRTISDILGQRAYTGCTINFKTYRVSYKDKKTRLNRPEKQLIFEDTQEAIIDKVTWDRVQKIRKNKRRPTQTGKSSIFSGLLFCGDCGAKMYFATCNHFSPNQ